jgi:hypothetical protein
LEEVAAKRLGGCYAARRTRAAEDLPVRQSPRTPAVPSVKRTDATRCSRRDGGGDDRSSRLVGRYGEERPVNDPAFNARPGIVTGVPSLHTAAVTGPSWGIPPPVAGNTHADASGGRRRWWRPVAAGLLGCGSEWTADDPCWTIPAPASGGKGPILRATLRTEGSACRYQWTGLKRPKTSDDRVPSKEFSSLRCLTKRY